MRYLTRKSLGSPLIDGIFLVQKMCIYSCVTLPTTFDYARSSSMCGQLVMHQRLHHISSWEICLSMRQVSLRERVEIAWFTRDI